MGAENTIKIILHGEDRTRGAFSSALKGVQSFGKYVMGAAAAGVAALGGLTVASLKFAKVGGQYESIRDAFGSMTADMGVDVDKFQKRVADATGGQLDNLTILQGATRGLSLIGKEAFNNFGDDFVKMAELSKKAARATGQDVNYMFDSLITGISRESKMIIDNLGVTVDLTAAKEAYAETLGKTAAELTASEAKAAVLNTTMAALEETYGDVSVSAGGFSGAAQKVTTWLTNMRIEIGRRLAPIMAELAETALEVADKVMPAFWNVLNQFVVPILKDVVAFVRGFISALQEGMDPVEAAIDSFLTWTNAGENLSEGLHSVILKIGDLWDRAKEIGGVILEAAGKVLESVTPWISWKDVLIAVAIAIGLLVVPILWSLAAAIISIAAPVLAVIAVIALLRKAWTNDWLGIRSKIEEVLPVIKQKALNAIRAVRDWWDEHGQEILERAGEIWDDIRERVTRAAQAIRDWWDEHGQPFVDRVGEIWGEIKERVLGAAQAIRDWWDENGPTILERAGEIWDDIKGRALGAATAIKDWWEENGPGIVATVEGVWSEIKEGAAVAADYIRDELPAKLGEFRNWWDETWPTIADTLEVAWERIQAVVGAAIEALSPAIGNFIEGIKEHIGDFQPTLEAFKSLWEDLAPILGAVLVTAIGVLTGVINGLALAIGPLMQLLAGLLTLVISVIDWMVTSIKNGFRAIVAIFTGDTEALKRIWLEHWEKSMEIADRITGAIKDIIQGFVNTVVNFIGGLVGGIIGFFKNLYDRLVGGSIVPDITEGIKGLISGMVADVEEWISNLVDNVVDFFQNLYEDAIEWIGDFVDDAVGFFQGLRDDVDEIIGGAIDIFTSLKEYLSDKLTKAIDTLVSGPVAGFKSALSGVKDAAQWLIDKLSVLKGWLKKVGDAIPWQMIGHSPSPFEEWLRGIGAAMSELSEHSRALARALSSLSGPWLTLSQALFGMMTEQVAGDNWWERARALLEGARLLAEPGGFFGNLLQERMVDPLVEAVTGMDEQLEAIDIVTWLESMGWSMAQFQAMSVENLRAMAVMGVPGLEDAIKYKEILEERNALQEEYTRLQQKALNLEEALQDMEFLSAQLDLLKLIRESGLDVGTVLGDIQLGLDASIPDLVDAMAAAINALVETANQELEAHSPSAVMARIGRNVGRSLALGIAQVSAHVGAAGANLTQAAVIGAAGAGATYNFNLQAQYAYQDERTLRDELRILALLYGG